MNYEPNTTQWEVNAKVIHDADRKEWQMLMRVFQVDEDGTAHTCYLFPDAYRADFPGRRCYPNDMQDLHAPEQFGIVIPESEPKDGYL